MSSHTGRGANPPALLHIRAKPVGMLLGSWGLYVELMPREDACDSSTVGTLRPTLLLELPMILVGDSCDGEMFHELATIFSERDVEASMCDMSIATGTAMLFDNLPSLFFCPLVPRLFVMVFVLRSEVIIEIIVLGVQGAGPIAMQQAYYLCLTTVDRLMNQRHRVAPNSANTRKGVEVTDT